MIDPETLAAENGFSHWTQMNMAAAVPMAEVRDMCAADRCGRYGHNWACPPGCGSLETAARRIAGYACGILVQTTGTLQDDFDYATIEAVGAAHKRRFADFARQMLTAAGLNCQVAGDSAGTVQSQSEAAGSSVQKGTVVTITCG